MEDKLDIREKGGLRAGEQQVSDRRLFMQLLAFGNCHDSQPVVSCLEKLRISAVLYEDVNDASGIGVLTWSDNPDYFVTSVRDALRKPVFEGLTPKLEYSMLGRTYALGHEPNLDDWLLERPWRTACNPEWPWGIWYPLRRSGAFAALSPEEQTPILREHGRIGHGFGEAGYAHDIRLACFGIDRNDNDFVIGLVGSELYPLSACVQAMRKTRQTSQYIQNMGPFFVGKAVWRAPVA